MIPPTSTIIFLNVLLIMLTTLQLMLRLIAPLMKRHLRQHLLVNLVLVSPSGSWSNLMFPKVDKLSMSVMRIVFDPELTTTDTNYILSLRDGLPVV